MKTMRKPKIQLAVIDMAGTRLSPTTGWWSAHSMRLATAAGLPEDGPDREQARQYVLDTMGQSKIVVFRPCSAPRNWRNGPTPDERAYADLIANGRRP